MLSVIVPVKNGAETIGEQLDALASQSNAGDWELIVVDNGSTDETRAVIERFRDRISHLEIVEAPDARGASGARNRGAARAAGTHLVFCDADDVVDPCWLARLRDAADTAALVAGALYEMPAPSHDLDAADPFKKAADPTHAHLGFLPFADSANLLVTRDVFRELGGFDSAFETSEDVEFSWRAQVAGHRIAYCELAKVSKRSRAGWASAWRQSYRWSRVEPALYASFASHGMPARPWPASLRLAVSTVVRLPLLVLASQRGAWLDRSAVLVGRLWGSIRARRWYV